MRMMAQAANISIATTGTTMMMITFVVLSSFFPGLVLLSSLFPAEINRNSHTYASGYRKLAVDYFRHHAKYSHSIRNSTECKEGRNI